MDAADRTGEPFDCEWAILSSYVSFCCMARHHPDLSVRAWAKRQLAYPVYDEEHERAREQERKRSRVIALRRYR
jgi:hypothetical protein